VKELRNGSTSDKRADEGGNDDNWVARGIVQERLFKGLVLVDFLYVDITWQIEKEKEESPVSWLSAFGTL